MLHAIRRLKSLLLVLSLGLGIQMNSLSQDLDDYSFANFSSTTTGTLESINISMSSSGGFETDAVTSISAAGILPSGFSNLPTRSVISLAETSSSYSTKTITFDDDLPTGSFLIVEDVDQSEEFRITFRNSSGGIMDPFVRISQHNPVSGGPAIGTTTQRITLYGQVAASGNPINIFETLNGNVRSITLESSDHPVSGDNIQVYIAAPSSAFPVEYLSFDVLAKKAGELELRWETSLEINNDYFSIERSDSSTINWNEIGQLKGKGTFDGISAYSFTDNPGQAGVYYYRLKQTDFDGSFSYSKIRSIRLDYLNEILAYPSPVERMLYIENVPAAISFLQIFDANGRLFRQIDVSNSRGLKLDLDVRDLPKGLYILKVGSSYRKIIKQ